MARVLPVFEGATPPSSSFTTSKVWPTSSFSTATIPRRSKTASWASGLFAGERSRAVTLPVTRELRTYLTAHQLRLGRNRGLLVGHTETKPFDDRALKIRADKAWRAAGLTPITLHEARHTYASLLIAAGVNSKAISTYMGHASITSLWTATAT